MLTCIAKYGDKRCLLMSFWFKHFVVIDVPKVGSCITTYDSLAGRVSFFSSCFRACIVFLYSEPLFFTNNQRLSYRIPCFRGFLLRDQGFWVSELYYSWQESYVQCAINATQLTDKFVVKFTCLVSYLNHLCLDINQCDFCICMT